jgi:hypothetical protein
MIIDGKKIYIIIEHEFDNLALDLAKKLGYEDQDPPTFGYPVTNFGAQAWRFHSLFGRNNELWPLIEKAINAKYIPADGPKGCHVFDFKTEGGRLAFQLKYGDILS